MIALLLRLLIISLLSQLIEAALPQSEVDKLSNAEQFYHFASRTKQPSDKVTDHRYQEMYGTFLVPKMQHHIKTNRKMKLFEIGLGCDMKYGPGKSVDLWLRFLRPSDELWEAEVDEACAAQITKRSNMFVLTGDQANTTTLQRWVVESRAQQEPFDVIIDDGGHENLMIYNSFHHLFEQALAPGGLYFIEDLHVSRSKDWQDTSGQGIIMIDVIKDWLEQLVLRWLAEPATTYKHKLPAGIKGIYCQSHACVISKCRKRDDAHCS